jgi:hypothetical protein
MLSIASTEMIAACIRMSRISFSHLLVEVHNQNMIDSMHETQSPQRTHNVRSACGHPHEYRERWSCNEESLRYSVEPRSHHVQGSADLAARDESKAALLSSKAPVMRVRLPCLQGRLAPMTGREETAHSRPAMLCRGRVSPRVTGA